MRRFAFVAFLTSLLSWGQQVRFLPRGARASAIAAAADGRLYVASFLDGHGCIAELAGDGSEMRVLLTLRGSGTDYIRALALGPDGSIYAAGVTTSPDFPATPLGDRPSDASGRAFVLKLARDGRVDYSVLIGRSPTSASWIAVNARGEALVSGQVVDLGGPTFFTTPGAVQPNSDVNTGFIVKLDAAGSKALVAIRGFGSGPVAYDANDNIYVAGAAYGDSGIAPTPGAFQSNHEQQACAGTGMLGIACFYQYVAKISPDGTRLIYSTFVTGMWGATPAALFVDSRGNAIVAGSTYSRDYPVTPGAFQAEYRVTNMRKPQYIGPHPPVIPPPVTGYITKLNRDGTGLVWSTFFSGTGSETITSVQLERNGDVVVAGLSGSRDLPGAHTVPEGCTPRMGYEMPYLARLTADGATILASRYIYGLDPGASPGIALTPDGTPVVLAGQTIRSSDHDDPNSVACVVDPANNARILHVAPGQLLTLFGDFGGQEPASVTIGDLPATVLYSSAGQINIQAPYEISTSDVVNLAVQPSGQTTRLRVVPRAPAVFLDLARLDTDNHVLSCNGEAGTPLDPPLARNEDGSFNTCENRAARGSVVTLYLNGLGTDPPEVALQYPGSGEILSLEPDPGSPSGVWRMRVQLQSSSGLSLAWLRLLIGGTPLGGPDLGIWVKPE